MHIHTGKQDGLRWYNDLAIYFGEKKGSRFIAFHFPLHNGWCSHLGKNGTGRRIKGGWEYYEAAILTGKLFSDESKWHKLPTVYVPAKIVDLWRMRKKSWRKAMREDAKLSEVKPKHTKETNQQNSKEE